MPEVSPQGTQSYWEKPARNSVTGTVPGAMFSRSMRAARRVIAALAGVDSLLFPAFVQSDVILTNSRGIFGESLAEYALATILYFAKRLPLMAEYQRQRQWRKVRPVDIAGQKEIPS